ncbi:MAG: hydantoinase/oxoprolinase family protein [Rhodobacteraceae bacterium]|nr:hydantoinase/oxoprolinase family protein [Paracoccaceae bacterium]
MAIFLGVDTGGTYTDAVLVDSKDAVIASAKSLTTRHDLAIGIGNAVSGVLGKSGTAAADIALCSLSTTLATNALVEGHGTRICLVFIGFSRLDIARQGLDEALKGDPVIRVTGGHLANGAEAAGFDAAGLRDALHALDGPVPGFAVASQFATRNPAHEVTARNIIRDVTGAPVTCSHELSTRLGGPKRAMTAVLNARLIGMIDSLISSAEAYFLSIGITAPLMVVRGDGALISGDLARERPIETILSGPAASIVGARWLTGQDEAFVSDIGGTTTDVAVLHDGRPAIDPKGARVGDFHTMVEAVALRTTGLGGDSEVHMAYDGLASDLRLGPRRVVPVSLAAVEWANVVLPALDRQSGSDKAGEFDGRFVLPCRLSGYSADGLGDREARLLDRLGTQAAEMNTLLKARIETVAMQKLAERGLVMISALTPSDAAHVLGLLETWNTEAAHMATQLFCRKRTSAGLPVATAPEILAQKIVDQLTEQTVQALLEVAFAEDKRDFGAPPAELASHTLTRAGLDHHRGMVALDAALHLPIVGLGASAPAYYGAVGARLKTPMIVPDHAGVANAIGAVTGQVAIRQTATITAESEGCFRGHMPSGRQDFTAEGAAIQAVEAELAETATERARSAGAEGVSVRFERDIRTATLDGHRMFIEAEITAIAHGRPRIAGERGHDQDTQKE